MRGIALAIGLGGQSEGSVEALQQSGETSLSVAARLRLAPVEGVAFVPVIDSILITVHLGSITSARCRLYGVRDS